VNPDGSRYCYAPAVFYSATTQSSSDQTCKNYYGSPLNGQAVNLASFHNSLEANWLVTTKCNQPYGFSLWIGLKESNPTNTNVKGSGWYWSDGSDNSWINSAAADSYWYAGHPGTQPGNSQYDSVMMEGGSGKFYESYFNNGYYQCCGVVGTPYNGPLMMDQAPTLTWPLAPVSYKLVPTAAGEPLRAVVAVDARGVVTTAQLPRCTGSDPDPADAPAGRVTFLFEATGSNGSAGLVANASGVVWCRSRPLPAWRRCPRSP
jgi:hypothetical protein